MKYSDILNNYKWLLNSEMGKNLREYNVDFNAPVCHVNEPDLSILENVIEFWGLNFFPEELFDELHKFRDIAKWGKIFRFLQSQNVCDTAAEYGDLDIVIYCINHSYPYSENICSISARNGHLKIVKFLHAKGCKLPVNENLTNLDCLKYLYVNGYQITRENVKFAASDGLLNFLEFYHSININLNEEILYLTVINGHLDCLKFLHSKGAKMDENMCHFASLHQHFECLKYICENGCPVNTYLCFNASRNNDLQCLKYGHLIGFPFDERTSAEAVRSDSYECLVYLHQNGCFLYEDVCRLATICDSFNCLKYLHQQGFHLQKNLCKYAAMNGNFQMLKYLHENGCEITSDTHIYVLDDKVVKDRKFLESMDKKIKRSSELTKIGQIECSKYILDIGYN